MEANCLKRGLKQFKDLIEEEFSRWGEMANFQMVGGLPPLSPSREDRDMDSAF